VPGLAIHFERNDIDVWSGRQIDLDAYRYACKAFGFDKLVVINLTGEKITVGDSAFDWREFKSVEEFLETTTDRVLWFDLPHRIPPGCTPRIIGKQPHPKAECWYMFGPAAGWAPAPTKGDDKQWATMPQLGSGALHGTHVASIVMFDAFRWRGLQ